uniref:Uncharacterized protein n=1 Tax=Glossina palpalis gambiensis TaxID=67801 RepID=A0A1B0AS49_9MUSC
ILASASSETKVIAKPLVPKRPARATRCKYHSNAVERLKSRNNLSALHDFGGEIHSQHGKSENENNALLDVMSGEMTEPR